jgi:UDPglucose--hexose-1-phosphate uridylyltransferase
MTTERKGAERRLNLLTGEWILLSPERLARPWQGAVAQTTAAARVSHDPECYLCPGAMRAGGARNPPYSGTHIFDNDFPALLASADATPIDPLLTSKPESGICRVICYSPDHSLALSRLPVTTVRAVIDVWAAQSGELGATPNINAVTIFENRGEMMGASNPHPHGQIWATNCVPNVLTLEDEHQNTWFSRNGEALLAAYLRRELEAGVRIVLANDAFVGLVPFWATWPFETIILPRRPVATLEEIRDDERDAFAEILSRMTAAYDALFATEFPYSMGIHQRPVTSTNDGHFVMHMHFYPPLLRSAQIRKFMVGFEMFAMPQRDFSPEKAAQRLRAAL